MSSGRMDRGARSAVVRPPTLRVIPAPRAEPPALGRDWGQGVSPTGERYVQGSLAVEMVSPDPDFGPQPTATSSLPEIHDWARQLVQALLEVSDGSRPADQLSRWVAPAIRERAARRGVLARRRGRRQMPRPHVRRLRVCEPADGVAEVAAVVWAEGRVRAVALRLVGRDGRWVVTAWEQG